MSNIEYSPLATYRSLHDPHLQGYFSNTRVRRQLRRKGLINRQGEVISEQTFRLNLNRKAQRECNRKALASTIVERSIDHERIRQFEMRKQWERYCKAELVRHVRSSRQHRSNDSRPSKTALPGGRGRRDRKPSRASSGSDASGSDVEDEDRGEPDPHHLADESDTSRRDSHLSSSDTSRRDDSLSRNISTPRPPEGPAPPNRRTSHRIPTTSDKLEPDGQETHGRPTARPKTAMRSSTRHDPQLLPPPAQTGPAERGTSARRRYRSEKSPKSQPKEVQWTNRSESEEDSVTAQQDTVQERTSRPKTAKRSNQHNPPSVSPNENRDPEKGRNTKRTMKPGKTNEPEEVSESETEEGKQQDKTAEKSKLSENTTEKSKQSDKAVVKGKQSEKAAEEDKESDKTVENGKQQDKAVVKGKQSEKAAEEDKQSEKAVKKGKQPDKTAEEGKQSEKAKGSAKTEKPAETEEAKPKKPSDPKADEAERTRKPPESKKQADEPKKGKAPPRVETSSRRSSTSASSSGSESSEATESDETERERFTDITKVDPAYVDREVAKLFSGLEQDIFLEAGDSLTIEDFRLNKEQVEFVCKRMAKKVEEKKTVRFVSFTQCRLSADLLAPLLKSMRGFDSIIYLNLSENKIGADGARLVAEYVTAAKSLKSLELHGNPLGDEGVEHLTSAVKQAGRATLNQLGLGASKMTDAGMRSVAGLVRSNIASLSELHLSETTGISREAWTDLGKALAENTHISSMSLDKCGLNGGSGLFEFLDAAKSNTSLKDIDFEDNKVTQEDGLRLSQLLATAGYIAGLRSVNFYEPDASKGRLLTDESADDLRNIVDCRDFS